MQHNEAITQHKFVDNQKNAYIFAAKI